METTLLHELPLASADAAPERIALTYGAVSVSYQNLAHDIEALSSSLIELGIARAERVGVYLEKRIETVVAAFGAAATGAVFVPLNPLLKPPQVVHILQDCQVRVLVTSPERLALLQDVLGVCRELRHVILVGDSGSATGPGSIALHGWRELAGAVRRPGHRVIDTDMAAILYTSGSTGRPKGVVLSHRNMVIGAKSVASYLENREDDTLLAALPLSFDAGFSQLTTAFHARARVVLLNYLLPRDLVSSLVHERITGLTGVPPLYMQLAQLEVPASVTQHLRYFANTGGRMPREVLSKLRTLLPQSRPFLMYGLTEAFRASYLPPEEADRRPDSIGKAIPNTEILVLREDGSRCLQNEPGELVQRGALVAMGYWNDAEKTAERFKPLPPNATGRHDGLVLPEIAVFSGDTVREDEDGFLYFVGRRDEMIKTSGYRVSPTEVEEVLYLAPGVAEAVAFGVPHSRLGHAIVVVATSKAGEEVKPEALLAACRSSLPLYMLPAKIDIRPGPLPRNVNGKIDRKLLSSEFELLFAKENP